MRDKERIILSLLSDLQTAKDEIELVLTHVQVEKRGNMYTDLNAAELSLNHAIQNINSSMKFINQYYKMIKV